MQGRVCADQSAITRNQHGMPSTFLLIPEFDPRAKVLVRFETDPTRGNLHAEEEVIVHGIWNEQDKVLIAQSVEHTGASGSLGIVRFAPDAVARPAIVVPAVAIGLALGVMLGRFVVTR